MDVYFIESPAFSRQRDTLMSEAEFAALTDRLAADPEAGTSLGGCLFKLRVGVEGRGRRGGARVIYGLVRAPGVIVFLACYPKNAKADLTKAELAQLRAQFRGDPP
jgi:hypothetical protein